VKRRIACAGLVGKLGWSFNGFEIEKGAEAAARGRKAVRSSEVRDFPPVLFDFMVSDSTLQSITKIINQVAKAVNSWW